MIKLFDSFVLWFNGLFGLEYAGYSWITAIAFIILSLVASYYIIRAAVRPLIPLFTAEHSKIGAERPDIEKGVREAYRSGDSPPPVRTNPSTAEDLASNPFIQILPLEDLSHACEDSSKLAGLLADGLANTLMDIPHVEVLRCKLETLHEAPDDDEAKYVVSGTVTARDEDMVLKLKVRDSLNGDHVWTQTQVCAYDKMPEVERAFAVEIASAVVQRHRGDIQKTQSFISQSQPTEKSGSTYQNGPRPSPALPRKNRRQAM